jgi:hypothetical protein
MSPRILMRLTSPRLAPEHAIAIFHSRLECRKQNTRACQSSITSSMSEGEVGQMLKGVREQSETRGKPLRLPLGPVSLFPIIPSRG